MTQNPQSHHLPPTGAIELDDVLRAKTEHWFDYPVRVYPHHTDYGGIVWHGNYLTWMEQARVDYFRSIGVDFAELVSLGCDLPVVELSIRYHRPLRLGMSAIVRTRMIEIEGVRMNWDQYIQSPTGEEIYTSAKVVLVGIDREKGKIMRKLPSTVKDALVRR
jgi:acyl-CoA thioester hydrolase